ncbi:DUF2935 domain-containing protein [Maledivibacter halophilus]|uniref:Uncharacterized protein n=1 Tax=Maledivibacter halophilus TaxID=36842 RepID=A0A1T5IQH0_9FIRM|nr:DUF2935 domain-containing protein [Maledivibacter halophilus]SKC41417.1 protein of unknown function [Maledivibacter halophilus]
MYCFTIINNLKCVLEELKFWSDGSMEHNSFILKFADCRNKRLGYDLNLEIQKCGRSFKKLSEDVNDLIAEYDKTSPHQYSKLIREIRHLVRKFIKCNKYFLSILYKLQQIGLRDDIWQTFIKHLIDEQQYALRLMKGFKKQLERR